MFILLCVLVGWLAYSEAPNSVSKPMVERTLICIGSYGLQLVIRMPVFAVRSAQRQFASGAPRFRHWDWPKSRGHEEMWRAAFDLCILTYGGMNTDLKLGIRPSVITGVPMRRSSAIRLHSLWSPPAIEWDDPGEELPFLFGRPVGAQAERTQLASHDRKSSLVSDGSKRSASFAIVFPDPSPDPLVAGHPGRPVKICSKASRKRSRNSSSLKIAGEVLQVATRSFRIDWHRTNLKPPSGLAGPMG